MSSFCIIEKNSRENHAGSKARNDAASIMTAHGYAPLCVHHSEQKGMADKLYMCLMTFLDWHKIQKKVGAGDNLLIQYPLAMYPRVSELAIPFLRRMKKNKVNIILLIHDLESLRGLNFPSERLFLEIADSVIVHNEVMKNYLLNQGYEFSKIYILGFFDYLIPNFHLTGKKNRFEVAVAGNLKLEKCGYIKYLPELGREIAYHLYGPGYQGKNQLGSVIYRGQYTPEELPEIMTEGWGLVWDGDSIKGCRGTFGKYLKYNNPHKISLYLASGIPVIVWKQSAVAPWIQEKKIGIVVDSLEEIPSRIGKITEREYEEILKNAQKIGERLREGTSLGNVIDEIENNGNNTFY